MKFKLLLCACLFTLNVCAQTHVDSSIYICTDAASGVVRLNNLKSASNCVTRVVKAPVLIVRRAVYVASNRGDPLPASNALIVGASVSPNLQVRRDAGRGQILQTELNQAQKNLILLQAEYQNTMLDHLGDTPEHTENATRAQNIKKKILLTQANIEALQREIERN